MKKMTTALLTTLILGSLCAAAQNAGNLVVNGDFKQVESPKEETAWKPGYCFIHAPSVPNDAMRDEVKKGVKWEIRDGMGIITKSRNWKKSAEAIKNLRPVYPVVSKNWSNCLMQKEAVMSSASNIV